TPLGPGQTSSKRGALLYFQFFGTACHTASAKLWNNMIHKLQVTARQSRIDNVDPVYTGVLPVFQLIDDLFWSAGYPGGLRPETGKIAHGHSAIRVHGAQFGQMTACTFRSQLPNRRVKRQIPQVNA